jgi:hypothetical protein
MFGFTTILPGKGRIVSNLYGRRFNSVVQSWRKRFYLHNHDELIKINRIRPVRSKCNSDRGHFCFIGPHRKHQFQLRNTIIMETGAWKAGEKKWFGMNYTNNFALASAIHSEYGMTELLSQAYSLGEGVFALLGYKF